MWGLIYRSVNGPFSYRVLPGDTPVQQIHSMRKWVGALPRRFLAPVEEVNNSWDPKRVFDFVRYKVGNSAISLAEALRHTDPAFRLTSLATALETLQAWWLNTGGAILPTPAEIVLSRDAGPLLLPRPTEPVPTQESVFDQPERALYVSPTRVRGERASSPDSDDRYAFAVMLATCLYERSDFDAGETLVRAAAGVLFDPVSPATRIPAWMRLLPIVDTIQEKLGSLLCDASFDPITLAFEIRHWVERLSPLVAVKELRQAGSNQRALDLIVALLRVAETETALRNNMYELLLDAGEIASKYLHRPLDALEFQERAIATRPDLPKAYQEQLVLIGRIEAASEDGGLPGARPNLLQDLDAVAWRDFNSLSPKDREEHEHTMSRYLLNRGRFAEAQRFILPLIYDPQRGYLPAKFELNLDYVEALIGLPNKLGARDHFRVARRMVEIAGVNGRYEKRLVRLENLLRG